jgi:hypothetical protein
MSDIFLPYNEIFHHVQALRAKLGLPLLKNSNTLGSRLRKLRRTGTRGHTRYSLEDALRVYTHLEPTHKMPWNRLGTAAEITSRRFMPLATACEAFRVSSFRLNNAIRKLDLLAWIHPHTGKRWVHIEQAAYVAQWRSIHCLRRYLTPAQLEHITSTRPCKTCTTKWGEISCAYYVPEFSHIGSRHTSYKLPRRLQNQKTK